MILIVRSKIFFVLGVIVLLAACSSMDEVPVAHVDYTASWEYAPQTSNSILVEKEWWKSFESGQLQHLIDVAHTENPDVRIAAEHVKQAELQMSIANASLFPSFGLSASSGERKIKDNDGNWSNSGSTSAGITASYEVDLWGEAMASRHAGKANYNASVFSNEATRLSISAGIATAWFNYLALYERIETAKKNIEIAERIQKIVDSLYKNGIATAAEAAQQKTNLLSQQVALLPLQLQFDQTRSAIALLEGQVPQGYQLPLEKLMDLKLPDVDAGIPSDIITRRPDIGSMEAQLQAASADIYAARTALLPSVQLGANLGQSSSELFSLSPALQSAGWSLSLAQTLFAGGRLKNQVNLSQSRCVELLENYRRTILTALQEVDDALHRTAITQQQELNQQEIVAQSERSLKLTEARYREGDYDLQSLLDAQRSLFQAQDSLVQQRLARLKATVDLYKTLGGGWQHP